MFDIKIKGGDHENDTNHRDQLIRDMIYVCCLPNISDKNRKEFINVSISWSFTDRSKTNIKQSAKYKGCPYWSELALQRLDNDGNWEKKGKKDKGLRHEHIVPRKIFIDAIEEHFKEVRNEMKAKPKELDKILNREFEKLKPLMDDRLKGCVITKEDEKKIDGAFKDKMPDWAYKDSTKPKGKWKLFAEIKDPWARYKDRNGTWNLNIKKLEWKISSHWKTKNGIDQYVYLQDTVLIVQEKNYEHIRNKMETCRN